MCIVHSRIRGLVHSRQGTLSNAVPFYDKTNTIGADGFERRGDWQCREEARQWLVNQNRLVLCQGMTLVVPKSRQNELGFSPCGTHSAPLGTLDRFTKYCLKPFYFLGLSTRLKSCPDTKRVGWDACVPGSPSARDPPPHGRGPVHGGPHLCAGFGREDFLLTNPLVDRLEAMWGTSGSGTGVEAGSGTPELKLGLPR
jgi:hypothetical protein